MRAQNLTISIPYVGCDKDCPYCVSKMTGYMKSWPDLMWTKADKVYNLAKAANVTSVLFTGKGEPLLNRKILLSLIRKFSDWPIEVQTNGIWLSKNLQFLDQLAVDGADIIAVSIDTMKQFWDYNHLFRAIKRRGMVVRVCMNVTGLLGDDSFFNLFNMLTREKLVDQILFRNITVPNNTSKEHSAAKWIVENVDEHHYSDLYHQLMDSHPHEIRTLPDGTKVYDVSGVSVTFSDYCIQDSNDSDDIRSLIFQEDGHVYTSWNSKASILF